MPKTDLLIHTKLHMPAIRPALVPRLRLQEQIAEGMQGPLTLVIAPAGFGKSTLVASFIASCGMQAAWLSLDKEDDSEGRFLAYLIAALQCADERLGEKAAQLLAEIQPAATEAVLTSLINDLGDAGEEIVLVLDDYQMINNQAIHEMLTFLLEHCPRHFHLVIATRSEPPLPLARLRARSQMIELRTADLSFTVTEAAQFLNDIMGLQLDARSIAVLEERTEGWIAGLQMAALSLRDRKEVTRFIEEFSGTNRHILDYLMEEILDNQPPEIQNFLLNTSILERLTAPLCDAVLANDEGPTGNGGDRSAAILEYLERANLFVVALDDERTWYRYHHLFASLLRVRLGHSIHNAEKALHQRAAGWLEQNGYPEDAIQHALAAQNYPHAARLVEDLAETTWLKSEYARLIEWIKALPEELARQRPWLCVWFAWSQIQIGPLEEARVWTAAAELALQKTNPDTNNVAASPPEIQALEYEIAILNMYIACLAQEYDRATQLAAKILENPLPNDKKSSLVARCHVLHGLCNMYYTVGELDKAEECALETIRLSREIGFNLRHIHAVCKLAALYQTRGQLTRSFQLLKDTLAFFEQQGLSHYSVIYILRCRLVDLLYEWNQVNEIECMVDEYGLLEPPLQMPYICVDLYNQQARQLLLKNDLAGARHVLDKAEKIIKTSFIWAALSRQTETLRVSQWLKAGDIPAAVAWDRAPLEKDAERFPFLGESRLIARARILMAQSRFEEAFSLLDQLRDSAKSGGRYASLVSIRVLRTLALQADGRAAEATGELIAALELAEGETYIRTFIDEGPEMARLLTKVAGDARSPRRDYVRRLLAEMVGSKTASPSLPETGPTASPQQNLIEPLSPREIEVLQLIATGKTNQEIARQIIVSPGTVKAHTASIYRKLDVANRTEAVARARQLGILP